MKPPRRVLIQLANTSQEGWQRYLPPLLAFVGGAAGAAAALLALAARGCP